jgi:hypothetical protein
MRMRKRVHRIIKPQEGEKGKGERGRTTTRRGYE